MTTNPTVFAGLPGVYGIVPTSSELTTALFQSYKISTIHKVRPNGTSGTPDMQGERLPAQFCSHGEATGKGYGSIGTQWLCQDAQLRPLLPRAQVAIVFRSDNDELAAACMAAQLNAKQNLVTYMDLSFTASDDLANVTLAINASDVDALVACVTSTDAADMYRRLDAMRRPLKNIMFTHGPSSSTWNAALGSISGVRHGSCDRSDVRSRCSHDSLHRANARSGTASSGAAHRRGLTLRLPALPLGSRAVPYDARALGQQLERPRLQGRRLW